MRIFILLIFLITFNLQAKHKNLFDRDNIPKFKPRLEEPFYVKIYIPIAYISFDPYADVIMIRKKNYRNSLLGIIGERVLITTQIKKQTAALNLILKQDKYPKDIFSDLVDIKTQKVAARLHKIRHVKKKEVEPVYNLFFSFTELDDTDLIGFLKQIGVKRKEFFLKFLRDTLAVDRLHDRLLVPSLPLTYKQVSKTIYHSNNQGYFTRVMLALIIEIPKYKANVTKMKKLYHFFLNENKTPNVHKAIEFKSFKLKARITIQYILPDSYKVIINTLRHHNNKKVVILYGKYNIYFINILTTFRKYKREDFDSKYIYCSVKSQNKVKEFGYFIARHAHNIKKLDKIRKQLLKNNQVKNSHCRIIWRSNLNDNMGQFMFTYPIKIGQVSRVFEDQNGYHVAKLIGGTLRPEVIKYDSLHYLYKNEQLYFLLERYLKLIKRYAYKVIYITNEHYDDSYMHRAEIESLIDYLYLLPK